MDSTIQDDLSSLDEVSQSKFCVKCGADLQGCVLFCPSCGKSIVHPTYDPDRVPRKKISGKAKRRLIRAGIGALVVAILLVIFVFNGRALSPRGAVDNYVDILNGQTDKVAFSVPMLGWLRIAELQKDYVKNIRDLLEETIQKNIADLQAVYGPYHITGKIISEQDLNSVILDDINKGLAKYKAGDATAGKVLQVELTIAGRYQNGKTIISVTTVKIGLHWYLITYSNQHGSNTADFLIA